MDKVRALPPKVGVDLNLKIEECTDFVHCSKTNIGNQPRVKFTRILPLYALEDLKSSTIFFYDNTPSQSPLLGYMIPQKSVTFAFARHLAFNLCRL
jgi:hypothetical protein